MNKNKILIFIISLLITFSPLAIFADDYSYTKGEGLVPKCGEVVNGKIATNCDFNQLMILINKVINFIIVDLATPVMALILIYVGITYLTSGGNKNVVQKSKKILMNVVFGYLIVLVAWLVIKTILKSLGFTGPTYLSLIINMIS